MFQTSSHSFLLQKKGLCLLIDSKTYKLNIKSSSQLTWNLSFIYPKVEPK